MAEPQWWHEYVHKLLDASYYGPIAQRLNQLEPVKLAFGGAAAMLALAFLIYLVIFQDLPVLDKEHCEIDYNPAGLPPSVTLGTLLRIGSKSLPLIGAPPLKPNKEGTGFVSPDLEIKAPLHVDIGFLRNYLKAVDSLLPTELREKLEKEGKSWIAARETLPKRVPPIFLSAVASSLIVLLVSHSKFPIAMIGGVNTHNTYEWTDPSVLESYDEFAKKKWQLVAKMGKDIQRKKRGAEFAVSAEVVNKDTGKTVFKMTFWVLKMLPKSTKPEWNRDKEEREERLQTSDVEKISIKLSPTSGSPRTYATVSGDCNPIHMSGLLAKAFGLPGAIAHGNLMVAAFFRALEITEPEHPINKVIESGKPFEARAAFRSIMQVGKTFDVHADKDMRWLVAKGDRVCTEGSVSAL